MQTIQYKNQKILLISDTHGRHRKLEIKEQYDMVIHCGDACNDGNMEELKDFFVWFSNLNIPHRIFVNGNHDLIFELEPEISYQVVPNNVIWLNDKSTTIAGIRLTALSPYFYFYEKEEQTKPDIILSHFTPKGILDNEIGSEELCDYVLKAMPDYHIFGHNHTAFGTKKVKATTFINASVYHLVE